MGMSLRPSAALSAALILGAVAAPAASADTLLVADPSASNISVYGSTAAWSRKAGDGTYRLVVRDGGQVADAPVPASSRPYDPDIGPTSGNGRVVVYARGGDLYRYDVGAASEQKITALSSQATERAPSFSRTRSPSRAATARGRAGTWPARAGRSSACPRTPRSRPTSPPRASPRASGPPRAASCGSPTTAATASARSPARRPARRCRARR